LATRVFEIAKELGVKSKSIVDKCHAEGIPVEVIKGHMSTVSAGLEATIREWFASGEESHNAVEQADKIDLDAVREDKGRKARKAGDDSDTDAKSDASTVAVEQAPAPPRAAPFRPATAQPVSPATTTTPTASAPAATPTPATAAQVAQPAAPLSPVASTPAAPPAATPMARPAAAASIAPPAEQAQAAPAPASPAGRPSQTRMPAGLDSRPRAQEPNARNPAPGPRDDRHDDRPPVRPDDRRGPNQPGGPGGTRRSGHLIAAPFTIKDISAATGVKAADIVKKLFLQGVMATINSGIDVIKAQEIMMDFNIELEVQEAKTAEETVVGVR
jgi:translation initiation factor IF-2